ncbi:LysR family transcriptional regulator [Ramlibacter sp. G-1-2-2]|uniref:LysR family transcriptional regulator n=1 Tax=Ramlibacter agri TaxID=2728837 RepID=A0A848H079_9BURK|nr:LysR substrate-binding domain-containing protein [Ramlibacter agri]NML44366.1 LysR family transcriptional regulator [Ramlibacter agri]
MNLRQMEVFRAVMLTGGVGGAAELLHVSQPAVSKVLAQAQKQAGFALFERVKGRLVPTPEGQHLHAEIEAVWRGVERIRDVSRQLAAPRTGTLRLAVSASVAPYLVPRAIALLTEGFPELKSQTEILIAPIMVNALLDHSADLGVAMQPNEHPNLVAVQSYRCGFACAMREDHPLAAKRALKPADLRGERIITSPPGTPYGQALRRAYGPGHESLRLDLQVRSSTSACWQAQAGGGIAVVDRAAVAGESFRGLAVRSFQTREKLQVSILRNRYRPLSALQKAFCTSFDRVWKEAMAE